jgi:hypothetical protein
VFEALALALLDIAAIPPAIICCLACWRLPAVFSNSGSKHSAIWTAAGNALVDLLLLPAAFVHLIFPWRIPSVFARIVADRDRVAILTSAAQGFIDLPFALLALVCCVSVIQTHGMFVEVSATRHSLDHKLPPPCSHSARSCGARLTPTRPCAIAS